MSLDSWSLIFTALSSLATLVLAVVAWYQARRIKRQDETLAEQGKRIEEQIELGNLQAQIAQTQADSAIRSVKITEDLYKSSVRSRIDQQAPEVQVFMGPPKAPLIDRQRSAMPQHNELRLLHPESFSRSEPAAGKEFVFARDREVLLWFYGRGLLYNEGKTTARVRLGGESRYVSGTFPQGTEKTIPLPTFDSDGSNRVALLRPGEHALFEWAAGHSLGDWAFAYEQGWPPRPEGTIWINITIFDNRQMGIIDTIWLQFSPDVLSPVSGSEGHWKVTGPTDRAAIGPFPRVRSYRHEGAVGEDLSQVHQFHEKGDVD